MKRLKREGQEYMELNGNAESREKAAIGWGKREA